MAEKKSAKKPVNKAAVSAVAAARAKAAAVHEKTKGHGSGFMTFIREQGVVGLAVGLAIGTAAGDTVKKLVEAFINPLVQMLVGSQSGLQAAEFTLDVAGRKGEFMWGAFVSSLISLLATAVVVYFIIHLMKLDKLDKKKD